MKKFFTLLVVSLLSFGLLTQFAEARRLGGGSSIGKQRSTITRQSMPARPAATPNAAPTPVPAPAPSGASRWLGPLAGLAAGGLLASMFMGHGFGGGGGFGSLLMILALVAGGFFLFRMMRRPATSLPEPVRYNNPAYDVPVAAPAPGSYSSGSTAMQPASTAGTYPAGFDAESFLHHAKVNFIRLQAANDRGDLNDISEFTTPEMYAEISMQIKERGAAPQTTEVVSLNAEIAEVTTEGALNLASVRFSGLIREQAGANAEPFDEVWNLQKPVNGITGWQVAGIQQLN